MNSWIEKNIQIDNDRIAIKTFNKSYTFNDLHKIIYSYIDNLKTIIKPNEPVGFLSEDISEYAIFTNAVPMAKGIFVPLNPYTTKNELSKRLIQINCKKIIFTKKINLIDKLNNKEFDLIQIKKSSYSKNIKSFWPKKNDIHSILFTSGTSRIPKPVQLSVNNIETNCYMSQKNLKVSNEDIWLLCMPPFHAGGLSIIFRSMILGTSFYVENNFNSEKVVELIIHGKVSIISLVPTMLLKVLDRIELSKQIIPDKFKFILCGGAAVSEHLISRAEKLGIKVLPTYGMTETCSQIATTSPEDHYRPKGSVGKSLSNIDIKFDKNNQILVSGPTVARYFGTKRRKKWLETGDLGYIDKSGYLYLIGRFDEQIISGGENINPTEIESEIIKIPYIDEAVIFGIKDNYWGEKVVLAISSKKKNISLEQINKKLKKLDSYKYPKKLIVFSDPLPKNNIGKIDKNKLKTKIAKCKV